MFPRLYRAKKSFAAAFMLCLRTVKFKAFHCVSQNSYRKDLKHPFQVVHICSCAGKQGAQSVGAEGIGDCNPLKH